MTDEALTIAIRAEEASRQAHHRLDRMNGSIDRLGREVGDLRAAIAAARAEATATGQQILRRLEHGDGVREGATSVRSSLLDSRRALAMVIATLAGSGLFTALFTYIVRS